MADAEDPRRRHSLASGDDARDAADPPPPRKARGFDLAPRMRATYAASASSLALNPKETGMEEDGDVRSRPPDDRDGGADAARRFAAKAGEYGERARIGDGDRRHAAVAEWTASTPRSYKSKPPM